jgi:hypothetical protein
MRTYKGWRHRFSDGNDVVEDRVVLVQDGDGPSRPLPVRLDLCDHSPDGFEWGYTGSGPAQLALALAADATGDDFRAVHVHQQLKFRLVAGLPATWTLTQDQVLALIVAIEDDEPVGDLQ